MPAQPGRRGADQAQRRTVPVILRADPDRRGLTCARPSSDGKGISVPARRHLRHRPRGSGAERRPVGVERKLPSSADQSTPGVPASQIPARRRLSSSPPSSVTQLSLIVVALRPCRNSHRTRHVKYVASERSAGVPAAATSQGPTLQPRKVRVLSVRATGRRHRQPAHMQPDMDVPDHSPRHVPRPNLREPSWTLAARRRVRPLLDRSPTAGRSRSHAHRRRPGCPRDVARQPHGDQPQRTGAPPSNTSIKVTSSGQWTWSPVRRVYLDPAGMRRTADDGVRRSAAGWTESRCDHCAPGAARRRRPQRSARPSPRRRGRHRRRGSHRPPCDHVEGLARSSRLGGRLDAALPDQLVIWPSSRRAVQSGPRR